MGVINDFKSAVNKTISAVSDAFSSVQAYAGDAYTRVSWAYKKHSDKLLSTFGFATNADVYSIVTMIAYKMSEIPISVKKIDLKGGYIEAIDSDAYNLLYNDPTETYKEKIIKAAININLTGDVFFEKVFITNEEFPDKLRVLRSVNASLEFLTNGEIRRVSYYDNGMHRYIDYKNIIHVKLYDPISNNDGRGISPLQAGYQILSASNDLQTAASSLYKNLGVSYLVSDKSGSLKTTAEAKKLQKSINSRVGGAHQAGSATVTSIDADVQELGMTSKDLELMKSQPIKLRQMCNLFGADSSFFNDPDNKTFATRKQADKSLINNAVKPKLELIISAIEQDVNRTRTVKITPEYSTLDCLQEDQRESAEKSKIVTESKTALLTSEMTDNQKISILVKDWGYNEEEAKTLVNE